MYSTTNITVELLKWYDKSKRNLPWRKTLDPYKIWLSEVMLQQTQVKTVIPYYKKWIKKFPDFQSISESNLDVLIKLWEGLGYYNRCRNFYNAVKIIYSNFDSMLPKDIEDFKSLPGVGNYTASAVYSIAFSEPHPVMDGNVKRVMCRVFQFRNLTSFNMKRLISSLEKWIDHNRPGDFNQALMELGATLCKPINPKCRICPLKLVCRGYDSGHPERYPITKKKQPIPILNVLTGLVWKQDTFLILQRVGYKHLTNLWELPGGRFQNNLNHQMQLMKILKNKYNLHVNVKIKIGFINHRYSHFGVALSGFHCMLVNGSTLRVNQPYRWIRPEEINQFAFPKANHKLFELMKLT
jgi:A/G-specific adenine glycosylase